MKSNNQFLIIFIIAAVLDTIQGTCKLSGYYFDAQTDGFSCDDT